MTEICFQVEESLQQAITLLTKNGFNFIESYINFDSYYTTIASPEKTDYQSLLNKSVIIRHIVTKTGDVKNVVYKSKTLDTDGNVINEVKTKVKVDDIEKTKQIFNNIGLNCWCDIAVSNNELKKCEVVVNVQNVENLGTFVEIEEYPSIKDLDNAKKFEILKDIVKQLGLNIIGNDYSCKKPYMFLLKNSTKHNEL